MFYVSCYDKTTKMFGITDTEDGVTDYFTKEDILKRLKNFKIKGVSGTTVKVVNAAESVVKENFNAFGDVVRKKVNSYSMDACMELARSVHFVKQIKGLDDIGEVRQISYEYIYPASVQEVVSSAADYTNNVIEVDVRNSYAMLDALKNNVCLVLQHKTNGALTAFICTAGVHVVDSVYEPKFFDKVYLTKQLYDYTSKIEKLRPKRENSKNSEALNVFSCSLRFRRTGVKHDGAEKELSSPFYSVIPSRVLAMFVLDNPAKLGNRILPEFNTGAKTKVGYNFDFDMYLELGECINTGFNAFKDEDRFLKYVELDKLQVGANLTDAIDRFDDNFNYMMYLRKQGYSFKI